MIAAPSSAQHTSVDALDALLGQPRRITARQRTALGLAARPRTWDEFREGWRRFEHRISASTSGPVTPILGAPFADLMHQWCAGWVLLPNLPWAHASRLLRHHVADVRRPLVQAAAAALVRDSTWVHALPVDDGSVLSSFYGASLEIDDMSLANALLRHGSSGEGGRARLARLMSVGVIHAAAFLSQEASRGRRRQFMEHAEAAVGPTDLLRGTAEAMAYDVVGYVPISKQGDVREALLLCLARWAGRARATSRDQAPLSISSPP